MKTSAVRSKAQKLNWKPLKEIAPVAITVSNLYGKKVVSEVPSHRNNSKVIIP